MLDEEEAKLEAPTEEEEEPIADAATAAEAEAIWEGRIDGH